MNWLWVVVVAVFIFLLTYNPSSGTLNKYIQKNELPVPSVSTDKSCEPAHFQDLQFGTQTACPRKGAILQK